MKFRAGVVSLALILGLAACSVTEPSTVIAEGDQGNLRLGWVRPSDRLRVDLPSTEPIIGTATHRVPPVLLINFWASWCGPCKDELPLLERLSQRKGISVVGITRDRYPNYAEEALRDARVQYANWMDFEGTYLAAFANVVPPQGIPSSVLVLDGEVEAVHVGPFRGWDEFRPVLRSRRTA